MKTMLFEIYTLDDRIEHLTNKANAKQSFSYMKDLTPDEVEVLKDELVQHTIQLVELEEEKKKFAKNFSDRINLLKKTQLVGLTKIQVGAIEVTEEVFLIDDQTLNTMGYYNSEGLLVHTRELSQAEKHFRIPYKD